MSQSQGDEASEIQIHGALVEILGVGVLLRGESGIGKSECALELVQRGFRLVADDVVRLRALPAEGSGIAPDQKRILVGRAPELIRHYMEIHGVGLVFVPDLYGAGAVAERSRVDLVCRLESWQAGRKYERIGLDRPCEQLAGVPVPTLVLPVRPASSMATMVEVAAREHIQRRKGINAAQRLDDRLRGEAARRRVAESRCEEEAD